MDMDRLRPRSVKTRPLNVRSNSKDMNHGHIMRFDLTAKEQEYMAEVFLTLVGQGCKYTAVAVSDRNGIFVTLFT